MMEFELDTKSWHFKLANFGIRRVREWRDDNDLCSYIQAILCGSIWFIIALSIATVVIGLTGNMFYEIISTYGTDLAFSEYAKFTILTYVAVTSIITFLFCTFIVFEKIIPALRTAYVKACYGSYEKRNAPPSFLTLAYRKFKEKTCFKIKFKYEE